MTAPKLLLALVLMTACRTKDEVDSELILDDSDGPVDADGDGFSIEEDCDDEDAAVFPGATEACNGVDDDCDGEADEDAADAATWYVDGDGDGYGDERVPVQACEAPEGYTAEGGDCDDSDVAYHPGAPEEDCADPNDYNCDGSVGYADEDGDGYAACEECDDADRAVNPSATEVCDGVDNDCDGEIDVGAVDASTWYQDADSDGYGDVDLSTEACEAPTGYVADSTDCDDGDASANPGATELCDSVDNDCDGATDEDDAADAGTWYLDFDGDGYGGSAYSQVSCEAPSGYVADNTDCDDTESLANPGATEVCDGLDNDCDGASDEADAADATTWYLDFDSDGYGGSTYSQVSCSAPNGYVADNTDCDDGEAASNPGETEVCDSIDNDCDGDTDEDDAADATAWSPDSDGDGYGALSGGQTSCEAPTGYVADATDCDDSDAAVNPAATELCDGLDNDCDGTVDPGGQLMGDGALCPAASCDDLLSNRGSVSDGVWWIDPDGGGAFEVYCDMGTLGGGWTLVAKLTNQDGRNWTTASTDWTDTSVFGTTDDLAVGADARGEAWGALDADDLLLTDDAGFGYIATNDGCLGGVSAADYFTLALASFPYSGDNYYDTCTIDYSGIPTWATEPDWGSNNSSSTNLSFQDSYLVIARTDSGADTSGVISFYKTSYAEADVGLGALENGTQWTDNGYSQDIGGPTSCSYSDSQCASEYPETVYFWVR
ncbi:MAG: hypothetical protein H6741_31315 [Alphaproteobacteria bacterium]|nr:hypothetical protein [Alphaproteobacteria bacterium]